MSRFTLHRFGIGGAELHALVQGLRQRNPDGDPVEFSGR
jgi:hypothetical protein